MKHENVEKMPYAYYADTWYFGGHVFKAPPCAKFPKFKLSKTFILKLCARFQTIR